MIHVDALDFSGWQSKEVISLFWRSEYYLRHGNTNDSQSTDKTSTSRKLSVRASLDIVCILSAVYDMFVGYYIVFKICTFNAVFLLLLKAWHYKRLTSYLQNTNIAKMYVCEQAKRANLENVEMCTFPKKSDIHFITFVCFYFKCFV